MPAKTFLQLVNGVPTVTAGKQVSAGAADAGALPALNEQGVFDVSLMPTGIGADTALVVASEDLAAGRFVNIYDDGGTPSARLADASAAGKHAHGFVLSSVTSGNQAAVYFEGTNDQVTGATAGDVYLSATTPGGFAAAPPSGAGQVVQKLGVATSATKINAECGQHYQLAG